MVQPTIIDNNMLSSDNRYEGKIRYIILRDYLNLAFIAQSRTSRDDRGRTVHCHMAKYLAIVKKIEVPFARFRDAKKRLEKVLCLN